MVENNTTGLGQLVAAARSAEGAGFRYQPIEIDKDYDREKFVGAHEELNDLGEYGEVLEKDASNPNAREDLYKLLYGDPTAHIDVSPEKVRIEAREAFSNGFDNMARYVERNRNKFFELLDNKSMKSLLNVVPLYKNGNEEHDTLVGIVNDVNSLIAATQGEDAAEKIRAIALKRAKSDAVPDWAKKLIIYFGRGRDNTYVQRVFGAELEAKKQILSAAFANGDEIDREKVRNVLENSLNKAHEELGNADNTKKEEKDIWEKSIRPYYAAIARLAYISEEKKLKDEDEDEAEVKKKERKARRKALGMAA